MFTVAVLGLGLIGGSLLRALGAAGHQVRGYDAEPGTRTVVSAAGWPVAGSVGEAVAGADLVVLAVPLPAVGPVLDELAATGYSGIVSDVTSVKAPVHRLAAGRFRYVGGHPMAGRESSGFAASDPDLFRDCAWVLTLEEAGHPGADWITVAELLTGLGVRVVPATPAEHDAAVARISHLPHLTAAALAAGAESGLATSLAAGSYRDATRVAASPPALVAAMCGGNAAAVRCALDDLVADLTRARRLLDGPDPIASLTGWLSRGHSARGAWPPVPGNSEPIPLTTAALLSLGRHGGWITEVSPDRRTAVAVRPAAV